MYYWFTCYAGELVWNGLTVGNTFVLFCNSTTCYSPTWISQTNSPQGVAVNNPLDLLCFIEWSNSVIQCYQHRKPLAPVSITHPWASITQLMIAINDSTFYVVIQESVQSTIWIVSSQVLRTKLFLIICSDIWTTISQCGMRNFDE